MEKILLVAFQLLDASPNVMTEEQRWLIGYSNIGVFSQEFRICEQFAKAKNLSEYRKPDTIYYCIIEKIGE